MLITGHVSANKMLGKTDRFFGSIALASFLSMPASVCFGVELLWVHYSVLISVFMFAGYRWVRYQSDYFQRHGKFDWLQLKGTRVIIGGSSYIGICILGQTVEFGTTLSSISFLTAVVILSWALWPAR
jgi:hypothetical protein